MNLKLKKYINIDNKTFTQIDWNKFYFYNLEILKNHLKSMAKIDIGDYIIKIDCYNNIIFNKTIDWTYDYLKPYVLAYVNINILNDNKYVSVRSKSNSCYIHKTFLI